MKRLNLGCGKDIREGFINLDLYDGEGVDIVHNFTDLPLPFEDHSIDYILCSNILEHLKEYVPTIQDL